MGAAAKLLLWVVCVAVVMQRAVTEVPASSPTATILQTNEEATADDSDTRLKASNSATSETRHDEAITTVIGDASPPTTTQQQDEEALTAATTLIGEKEEEVLFTSGDDKEEEEELFTPGDDEATATPSPSLEDETVTGQTETAETFTDETEVEKTEEEEEVVIVETVVSTATVPLHTSRRLPRTVSPGLDASPAHYNEVDDTEEYRGFLSDTPTLSTFMSVASRRPVGHRRSDGNPGIDDIIQGIVELLGGNVKVTAAEDPNTRLTTFRGGVYSSTRINNRGPPRLSHLPFDILSSVLPTRLPIRPPITSPSASFPGRPQFVANTRPPFLAPLPPSLASRVTSVMPKPFATGIPIPVDLLPVDTTSDLPPEVITTFPDDMTEENSPVIAPSTTATPPPPPPSQTTPTTPVSVVSTSTPESSLSSSSSSFSPLPTSSTPSSSVSPTSSSTPTTTAPSITPSPPSTSPSSTPETPPPSFTLHDPDKTSGSKETETLEEGAADEPLLPVAENPETPLRDDTIDTTPKDIPPREFTTAPTLLEPSMLEPSSTTVTTPSESLQPTFTRTTTPTPAAPNTPPRATPPLVAPTRPQPPVVGTFAPRPGMVLDDPGYHPGQVITGAPVPHVLPAAGDVFDVTVSAHHGYGAVGRPPVYTPPYGPPLAEAQPAGSPEGPLLTTPAGGPDNFVSIDGRKTYFDLFPAATQAQQPQQQQQTVGLGVGVVIPEDDLGPTFPLPSAAPPPAPRPPSRPPPPSPTPPTPPPRPAFTRRPTQPSIRIDTCIVGDDSTCQERLGEVCRTEEEVSSCYCKPGTARRRPRTPCKRMVSLQVSIKVDRIGPQRIVWNGRYADATSDDYRMLQWEAQHAIANAMSKTRLGSAYLGNAVQGFYSLGGKVIINATVNLEDQSATRARSVRQTLQRQMIQVIQSHANNIGDSPLGVDGPLNPIPDVSDVNECNDPTLHNCHATATCINKFGTFTCRCLPGYTDRFTDDPELVGRRCESCSSEHCNKRGECSIKDGHKVCQCRGSYYGSQCEIDGEVLGVAVGASVAAVLIIILTLIFLCMWSRRWKAQDRKTEVLARGVAAAGATLGGYTVNVQHKGSTMGTQYGVTLEDRMRWAQIADTLSKHNIYAHQDGRVGSEGGPSLYTASSSDYLTASHLHSRPFSALNRVTRALSNSTLGAVGGSGLVGRLQKVFGRARTTRGRRGKRQPTEQPTALTLQQLMALHAQLSVTPEQMQGGGSPPGAPTSAAQTTSHIFQHQHTRPMAGPSSGGYPSLGTVGSNASAHPQQFGLQHLNPMAHLNSLAQQQQQQQHYSKHKAYSSQSTYGQFGPSSLNTMSHDGVSRAPTLGARTPVPLVDVGGATTLGPMGGASVAPTGLEGSEDEVERPYHLPRPKSRISLGVGTLAAQHSRIARSYNSLLF